MRQNSYTSIGWVDYGRADETTYSACISEIDSQRRKLSLDCMEAGGWAFHDSALTMMRMTILTAELGIPLA